MHTPPPTGQPKFHFLSAKQTELLPPNRKKGINKLQKTREMSRSVWEKEEIEQRYLSLVTI